MHNRAGGGGKKRRRKAKKSGLEISEENLAGLKQEERGKKKDGEERRLERW